MTGVGRDYAEDSYSVTSETFVVKDLFILGFQKFSYEGYSWTLLRLQGGGGGRSGVCGLEIFTKNRWKIQIFPTKIERLVKYGVLFMLTHFPILSFSE